MENINIEQNIKEIDNNMEKKICEILRSMQFYLNEDQLQRLKNNLRIILGNCTIEETSNEILAIEKRWEVDLNDYLLSKKLEAKSENTINRYKYELTRLLSYIDKPLDKINSNDISSYMMIYKQVRNVSNQTLKNIRAIFSSFFVWMRDRERINSNPMNLVEHIKTENIIKPPFTDEEREKMFRACKTSRDRALLEFLYSTAIRVTEMTNLNKSDIQLSNRGLIVYGKGAKERVVYINNRANMYLEEYLNSRVDNDPALFVSTIRPYHRLTKQGVEDIVRRIGKRAGVSDAYPHRFRRTAATNALNRGMPVQEVASMLGHSNLDTTMMYCTVDQESVKFHHKKYLNA